MSEALRFLLPLIIGGAYILAVWLTRRQLVRSAYEALGAYLDSVSMIFPGTKAELERIRKDAGPREDGRRGLAGIRGLSDDKVLRAWRTARTVELKCIPELPPTEIRCRLVALAPVLEADADPLRKELARQIRAVLDKRGSTGCDPAYLLREAMRANFDARDTLYETLASENTRASWLAYAGTTLTAIVAVALDRGALILLGAVGGVLSRLARVLRRRPLPTDYGAAWGSLILAPVSGGLAGLAAVLVLGALNDADFSILAESVNVSWDRGVTALNLAFAFLFGFSERLFNRTITSTTERLLPPSGAPPGSETVRPSETRQTG